jgi:hypothetical protein
MDRPFMSPRRSQSKNKRIGGEFRVEFWYWLAVLAFEEAAMALLCLVVDQFSQSATRAATRDHPNIHL